MTGEEQTDDRLEVEWLVKAVKRVSLFETLLKGPVEQNQLYQDVPLSRSTIHRTVASFTERGLLEETENSVQLTGFGRTVADRIVNFRDELTAATRLKPFLNTIAPSPVEVPVEHFTDATITTPKPRHPHFAIKRIVEMIEEAESLAMFSSVISPFYVEVAYQEMQKGMEIDVVFDEHTVEIILDEYAEVAVDAMETGRFDVYLHSGIPFELFIFDNRMGMAAHDENGIARAFIETKNPEAITWAEEVYESYLAEADPVSF